MGSASAGVLVLMLPSPKLLAKASTDPSMYLYHMQAAVDVLRRRQPRHNTIHHAQSVISPSVLVLMHPCALWTWMPRDLCP